MGTKVLQFCAIMLTALALIPAGTHLFELPNKISIDQSAYFTVQGIYRGWALFGIALIGALLANGALALLLALRRQPYALPLAACLLMAGTLAIFFTWIYPANQARRATGPCPPPTGASCAATGNTPTRSMRC